MKKTFVFITMVLMTVLTINAQQDWVGFGAAGQIDTAISANPDKPSVSADFIAEQGGEIELDFRIPGMLQSEIFEQGETYHLLTVPGAGRTSEEGKPDLPQYTQFVEIPSGTEAEVHIEYMDQEVLSGYNVYPMQMPIDLVGENYTFTIDENAYARPGYYPESVVELGVPMVLRGHSLVPVVISPVRFNPVDGTLKVYSYIKVKVVYYTGMNEITAAPAVTGNRYSDEFEQIVENFALNYKKPEIAGYAETMAPAEAGADYLIITHDDLTGPANRLAEHKQTVGLSSQVVTLSEIGTNPTADQITAFIKNAYNTWFPAPTYVVLLGDAELIPPHYKTQHPYTKDMIATDLYYATLDSVNQEGYPDYTPDIFVGRLPAETEAKANILVDKIIGYENNTEAEAWKNNIVLAGYFQDRNKDGKADRFFLQTSELENDYLKNNTNMTVTTAYTHTYGASPATYYYGEPIRNDIEFMESNDAGQKVIDSINSGAALIGHRDHGYSGGWGDPRFNISNIASLTNGDKLPVMFSINCESGKFDKTEGFVEQLVEKENGGLIAAFGASRISYSGYNDELSKGFYDAIWPDFDGEYTGGLAGTKKLGKILNYGKMFMYKMRPGRKYPWGTSDTYFKIEFELFNLIGDPALDIAFSDKKKDPVQEGWEIWNGDGGTGELTPTSEGFSVNVTQVGWTSWAPHVLREGITLENGKTYKVTFEAKAGSARDMTVVLGRHLDADPWWQAYSQKETFNLGTGFGTYSFTFEMNEDTYTNSRISFEVGQIEGYAAATTIDVKNLVIDEVRDFPNNSYNWQLSNGDGNGTMTVTDNGFSARVTGLGSNSWSPHVFSDGISLEKGKKYNVTFEAKAFSLRDIAVVLGKNLDADPWWIAFSQKELIEIGTEYGSCTFTFTMNEESFINSRISFELGAVDGYGVATTIDIRNLKITEDDGAQKEWQFQTSDQGEGTMTTTDSGVSVNVTNAGIVPWAVQAYQEGYRFEKGKTYRISFKAETSGSKHMRISAGKLIDTDPWYIEFTSRPVFVLSQGAGIQEYSFNFYMSEETCEYSKLTFELGNVDGTNVPVTVNLSDVSVTEVQ